MDDLISRKAAIKEVRKCRFVVDAIEKITKLPPAKSRRKKGKWIYGENKYGADGYHCNKCGFFVMWDYSHGLINYIDDYKFCPNCGADMRGWENDKRVSN